MSRARFKQIFEYSKGCSNFIDIDKRNKGHLNHFRLERDAPLGPVLHELRDDHDDAVATERGR